MRSIYDRYAPGLHRFAENSLAHKDDAADVVHDTMLDVWRTAENFAGRASVKTWIFTIARNKSVDRNRRSARVVLAAAETEIPSDTPSPEVTIQSCQNAERIRGCIEVLSPTHKRAIQLAFFEGFTYTEVAEIEGRSVGTIKTRIMHAKQLLMHCLSH